MSCDDAFDRRFILPPDRFRILDYPRKPVAVFNPGAVLIDGEVHVFPRVIFDYYMYTSSIGHFKMNVEDLIDGNIPEVIEVELVMWPKGREDLLGVEDPRVHFVDGRFLILYTAKGYDEKMERRDLLGLAEFRNGEVERLGYFKIDFGGERFYPVSNKDSTFLNFDGKTAEILTRPHLKEMPLSLWKGKADLEELVIKDLRVVRVPSDDEEKLGWSTNAVRTDEGWLVGWHSVMRDLSYRNGLALLKEDEILFTDHVLCPKGILEEYGDRALVIFGCGLIVYKEKVVWIGGVSDYAIGIFITSLEEVKDLWKRPRR